MNTATVTLTGFKGNLNLNADGSITVGPVLGQDGVNDDLTGTSVDDVLSGRGGHDTLDGGLGADTMDGGSDDDLYIVDNAGDVVIEAAGGGTDTVRSSLDETTLADHVEHLELTGDDGVKGTGNGQDNHITGGDGDDTLDGGEGADRLNGGGR